MSTESERKLRQSRVAEKRDGFAVVERELPDAGPRSVSSAPQSAHVPAPQREGARKLPEVVDAQIVGPKLKRGLALAQAGLALLKVSPLLASFVGFVLVPAFASTVYFAVIASDQWAAEARFEVRQVETESRDTSLTTGNKDGEMKSSGSQSMSGFSFTATGQDAYIVTNYIASRAIVDDLLRTIDLRAIFRRPEADFWARLTRNATVDDLVEYWKSMVGTYIDAPSGIVTLQVRAFRPDDAVTVANAVLQLSETLVNRISDRARADAMETAEKEVRRTYGMIQSSLADLHKFRDSAGMIDPMQTGAEIAKLLIPLMTERIRLESDLFVGSRNLDDSAPTIKALKSRLASVEQQITDLRGRLTSTQNEKGTLSASLAKFEGLELQRQFAEKMYELAQADLDRARQRAARQSIYLTVFVPPAIPEESRYPRRIAFPILILIGLTILWSIVVMTLASIEDHRL